MTSRKPPSHLSASGRAFWRRLHRDFELDDEGALALLAVAAEAFDRAREARELLKREGIVQRDRFNQAKPHPGVAVERDAQGLLIRALRALRLEPDDEPGTLRDARAQASSRVLSDNPKYRPGPPPKALR